MFQPPGNVARRDAPVHTSLVSTREGRTFEQRHLTVPRSARYAVLGDFDAQLSEVWIVCHGHGQLAARFLKRFLPLEREDRLIVAPEALSRYYLVSGAAAHAPGTPVGATWMTSEDRECEIDDYVRYLDLLYDEIFARVRRADVRLWVLGFSQGGATAARWVARRKVTPDRVVIWSGSLPQELDHQGAAALAAQHPLIVVSGRADEFATPERVSAQRTALDKLAVNHEMVWFEGGHDIDGQTLVSIATGHV